MNNILIIFNVLVSMMALLLYMMEVKEAKIRREKVRRARTKTKVLPTKKVNTNKYDLVVKDSVERLAISNTLAAYLSGKNAKVILLKLFPIFSLLINKIPLFINII